MENYTNLANDALVNELDIKFDTNGNIISFSRQKLKEYYLKRLLRGTMPSMILRRWI